MRVLLDQNAVRLAAAKEAVAHLGLLKPHAVETVYRLLEIEGDHPKAICTAYRREGEQISSAEKEALGIRKSAFMTKVALAELSELGMNGPIRAHEITVLRGSFVMSRYRTAVSAKSMILENPKLPIELQYDVFHPNSCQICDALHRKSVDSSWGLFPPQGCTCQTAPYGLHLHIDWIGLAITEEREEHSVSPLTLTDKIKRLLKIR